MPRPAKPRRAEPGRASKTNIEKPEAFTPPASPPPYAVVTVAVNRPQFPDFSGRQSPIPILRPAMSSHASSCDNSTSSGSASSVNVAAQGMLNIARVRSIRLRWTTTPHVN